MSNSESKLESFEEQKIPRLEASIVELNNTVEEQRKTINVLLSALAIAEDACKIGLATINNQSDSDIHKPRKSLGTIKKAS